MNDTARKILFKGGPDAAVHRAWDIGFSDKATVTWFCGDKVLCEQSFTGHPLSEIVPIVNARGFKNIGNDYVRQSELDGARWDTGKTLKEHMTAFGLRPVAVPKPINDETRDEWGRQNELLLTFGVDRVPLA